MRRRIGSFGWWWLGGCTVWVGGRSRRWRWHRAGWVDGTSRCSIGSSPGDVESCAVGQVVFRLAVAWIPAEQPLFILVDDTLARKTGKGISLATMHHDPLLSSARRPFCSFGHVWVVLALWVPLPMGGSRGFALPLLFRLYVGSKRGGTRDAPGRPRAGRPGGGDGPRNSPATDELVLARELLTLVAGWADGRTVYAVVDSAYAARTLLEGRPANVHVLSRLRPDAALWAGRAAVGRQRGRPRRKGHRSHPQGDGATRRRWDALPVTLYGRQVTPLVFGCTALWYGACATSRSGSSSSGIPAVAPRRGVLLHRPHRRPRLHPRRLCSEMDHRGGVPRPEAGPRLRGSPEPDPDGRRPHRARWPASPTISSCSGTPHAFQQGLATGWTVRPWYRSKPPRPSSTCSPPSARNHGACTLQTHRRPHQPPKNRPTPGRTICSLRHSGGSRASLPQMARASIPAPR